MERTQIKDRQRLLVMFLFHFLLFSYPLLSMLWRHSYPFFTVEVGFLFLLVFVIAFLLTIILSNVRATIANALASLLITVTFLIQFNLWLEGIAICVIASLVVGWRLKLSFYLFSLPVVAALILGAWFDSTEIDNRGTPPSAIASVNSELPPVLHIVLDGFIGLDGLPSFSFSTTIRDESYRFFKEYNFQVFPRAYSRYTATVDSLYSAFNFWNGAENKNSLEGLSRRKHIMQSNAVFDLFEKLGYQFNIYQTEHLDFCQSNPNSLSHCWEYAQPNVDSVKHVKSIQLRSRMLASVLLSQSDVLSVLLSSQNWLLTPQLAVHDPQVFSKLELDLLNKPNGRFFFAHVLLPHPPFTFLHDCSVNYESNYLFRVPIIKEAPQHNESLSEVRTGLYFEQMECALGSLRQVFNEMQEVGIFERFIIVVHGDHGSMISQYLPRLWNFGKLTPEQYRAHYSTLFAVKFPGVEFKIDTRTLPLSALLEGFSMAAPGFINGNKSEETFVTALPSDPVKVDSYIYLLGSYPMKRVDIDIFKD